MLVFPLGLLQTLRDLAVEHSLIRVNLLLAEIPLEAEDEASRFMPPPVDKATHMNFMLSQTSSILQSIFAHGKGALHLTGTYAHRMMPYAISLIDNVKFCDEKRVWGDEKKKEVCSFITPFTHHFLASYAPKYIYPA